MDKRPRLAVDNSASKPHVTRRRDGGEPPGDEMEQRVRQLETDFAFIKGKLEDMPTKDWMTTRLIWVVSSFLAISALVQVAIALTSKTLMGS